MATEKGKFDKFFDATVTGRPCGDLVAVPKFRVGLIEVEVVEALVRPGVLLHLTLLRTRLAERLPLWIDSLENLERTMGSNHCTKATGLFFAQAQGAAPGGGTTGYPARPNKQTSLDWFTNFEGAPAHGERLSDGEFFAETSRLLADQVFDLKQIQIFAEDPRVLAALRTGAVDHVDVWLVKMTATPAAEYLLNAAKQETVPGFTMKLLGKGRPAFLEAVGRIARESNIGELLTAVREIKAVTP